MLRLLFLPGLLLASASIAAAPAAQPVVLGAAAGAAASSHARHGVELFVELIVNGQANGTIARLVQESEHLWIDAQTLRDAGVDVRGNDPIDVARFPDFHATYDAAGQRLLLDVPPALLPEHTISAGAADAVPLLVDTGALVNYDAYVQEADGTTTASLWSEQRVFSPAGTASNTGVLRAGGMGRTGYIRYDTSLRRVDEGNALVATAGDLISEALPWTTAVRMGGVQIARSFRTRPDLITVPLPSFAGQAAVPTGVDLFINGYRQQHADVAPGRFVLDQVPVVNGAGEARIVTTDAVGRQVATTVPFYVAPELLRPGLTDFAVEAGALRRGYGVWNFGYGQAAASGSLRHGLTEHLTVEAHGEASPGFSQAGLGAVWAPGRWGSANAAVAISRRDGMAGTQLTAGYTYAGRRFSVGAQHIARSRGFADLGSFDMVRWWGGSRIDRVTASVILQRLGSVGLGYVDGRSRDGLRTRLASGSFSLPMGERLSAFGAVDCDLDTGSVSAQLRAILVLGRGSNLSAGLSRQPARGLSAEAAYSRAVPTAGGLGLSAAAALDGWNDVTGQVSAVWRARHAQLEFGAATVSGSSSVWGSATGSLVWLDRKLFIENQLPDAFAVVSTSMPDVPVYFENQLVGYTGADGRLFVPRVTAYHPGRFALDPVSLPDGAQPTAIETRASLREGTGAVVHMPIHSVHSVTVELVDGHDAPIAVGAVVTLPGGATTVVGWDGVVLLENLTGAVPLVVDGADGRCTATVTVDPTKETLTSLGRVRCTA